MQERSKNRLLDLTVPEARISLLDLFRLVEFPLQNGTPFLLLALVLFTGSDPGKFASRF